MHRSHDVEGTGQHLCDLDPLNLGVKVKDQSNISCKACPPKLLDICKCISS